MQVAFNAATTGRVLAKLIIPVVAHKAVAEVSKIGNIEEVSWCDSWVAKRTDGPKGG